MNKPVYLGVSIIPKYDEKNKMFCVDKDSFIVHMKTDGIYKDVVKDFEVRL